MNLYKDKMKLKLLLFYFAFYGAFGTFYPMISLFFLEKNLTAFEIGQIISIGLMINIIVQPIWGIVCDRFNLSKVVLKISLIFTSIFCILLWFKNDFLYVLIMFSCLTIFNVAVTPIIDSITLEYIEHSREFGFIRAWGSMGYAILCWLSSLLTNYFGVHAILYCYSLLMISCLLISNNIPISQVKETQKKALKTDLKRIFSQYGFITFTLAAILIFGTHQANATYYAILYKELGGGVVGVGISFFLVAGFEVPAMFLSNLLTKKFGLSFLLILSGILVSIRWFFYSLQPSIVFVLILLVLNGLIIGLFIVLCTQFVNESTPHDVQVTAHSLFWAFANGLGSMLFTYLGGLTIESSNIFKVYHYFGLFSFGGVILTIIATVLLKKVTKESTHSIT
ncbi:MFS transporter [Bacillus cereus]|uniref:MFS transporter n=1 Tax=Bacillus cereus TaxID=1396 RepID=UPI000B4BFDCF|nr:MFS transporter [Bacillus cereus]MEC3193934.1 MFS transporter [Bacillus cereus]